MQLTWKNDQEGINWEALSNLYRIAPLGDKDPKDLQKAFTNSMYKCFIFEGDEIVGVGRVLADGVDCAYICDVAVHPDYQSKGIGRKIMHHLMQVSDGHRKQILYANPGKEGFYKTLGFKRMSTAMAIFKDQKNALKVGLVNET